MYLAHVAGQLRSNLAPRGVLPQDFVSYTKQNKALTIYGEQHYKGNHSSLFQATDSVQPALVWRVEAAHEHHPLFWDAREEEVLLPWITTGKFALIPAHPENSSAWCYSEYFHTVRKIFSECSWFLLGKTGVHFFIHSHSFYMQFIFWTLPNNNTDRIQPSRWEVQKTIPACKKSDLISNTVRDIYCVPIFKIAFMPSTVPDERLEFYFSSISNT